VAVDLSAGDLKVLDGTTIDHGPLDCSRRSLVEIDGTAAWQERGEQYAIRLRAKRSQSRSEAFGLRLIPPSWMVEFPRTSLGPPAGRVVAAQRDPPVAFWRSVGGSGQWVRLKAAQEWPTGEIELALVKDTIIWDRAHILVLPQAAQIVARSAGDHTVEIDVIGFGNCEASVDRGVRVSKIEIQNGVRLVSDWDDIPPPYISVLTRFRSTDRPIEVRHRIRTPYTKGFITGADGRLVSGRRRAQFSDLRELWAHAGGRDGQKSELMARIEVIRSGPCVDRRLGHVTRFVDEIALSRTQRTLERLYATTSTLDADIKLVILTHGIEGGFLQVSAFDRDVVVNADERTCQFRAQYGHEGELIGARLVAWSIAQPEQELVELTSMEPGTWGLPSADQVGTWLVLGAGTANGRVRPRVFNNGVLSGEAPAIAKAMAIADTPLRKEALGLRLAEIAVEPWAESVKEDWSFLDRLLENAESRVPLMALDVLVELAKNPAVLSAWLFRSGGKLRRHVADMEDGLPFLWSLIPVSVWRATALGAYGYFKGLLGSEELARKVVSDSLIEIASYCPQANGGCWIAREALSLGHPNGEPTLAQLKLPELQKILRDRVGEALPRAVWEDRAAKEANWLNFGIDIIGSSPVVAAAIALSDHAPSSLTISTLRFCRDKGADSFDFRFRCAMQLQLSQQPSI
jgi:hypothetical protein